MLTPKEIKTKLSQIKFATLDFDGVVADTENGMGIGQEKVLSIFGIDLKKEEVMQKYLDLKLKMGGHPNPCELLLDMKVDDEVFFSKFRERKFPKEHTIHEIFDFAAKNLWRLEGQKVTEKYKWGKLTEYFRDQFVYKYLNEQSPNSGVMLGIEELLTSLNKRNINFTITSASSSHRLFKNIEILTLGNQKFLKCLEDRLHHKTLLKKIQLAKLEENRLIDYVNQNFLDDTVAYNYEEFGDFILTAEDIREYKSKGNLWLYRIQRDKLSYNLDKLLVVEDSQSAIDHMIFASLIAQKNKINSKLVQCLQRIIDAKSKLTEEQGEEIYNLAVTEKIKLPFILYINDKRRIVRDKPLHKVFSLCVYEGEDLSEINRILKDICHTVKKAIK